MANKSKVAPAKAPAPTKVVPTKAVKPEVAAPAPAAPAPAPTPEVALPPPPCPSCTVQRELIKRVLAHFDGGVLDPTLVPALREAVK